jgi:nitroimidazol reductase NimA-like FMN-containing flavoprotein (pyridoxamine 5'-phosphate oxidase superfamily)
MPAATVRKGLEDPTVKTVVFRDLTREESEQLLVRNHIGRIAFAFQGKVDVEPIGYVFSDGALYARTTPGTKLTVLAHHPWVAFEVDEIRGPFDWESVVVKGTVYFVELADTRRSRGAYDHALAVIQQAMPAAFTAHDPVPHRSVLLRIHVHEIEGRAASTG